MSDEHKEGETDEQKEESRLAYNLREQKRLNRELQERLQTLEAKKEDEDFGIGDGTDPTTRKLVLEVRNLKSQLTEVQSRTFRTDDDPDLEPYLQQVIDDHPELLKAYPNPGRRLEAARVMARGLQTQDAKTRSSQSPNTTPRVHLSGGGPSASKRTRTDSGDFEKFQEKMRDPKLSSEERKALADKWDADHPE